MRPIRGCPSFPGVATSVRKCNLKSTTHACRFGWRSFYECNEAAAQVVTRTLGKALLAEMINAGFLRTEPGVEPPRSCSQLARPCRDAPRDTQRWPYRFRSALLDAVTQLLDPERLASVELLTLCLGQGICVSKQAITIGVRKRGEQFCQFLKRQVRPIVGATIGATPVRHRGF